MIDDRWVPKKPEHQSLAARLQDGAAGGCQLPRWRLGAAPALAALLPASLHPQLSSDSQRDLRRRAPVALPPGWWSRPPPAPRHAAPRLVAGSAVRAGAPAGGLEVAEESGHLWSEEQSAHPLQVGTVYMREEAPSRGPVGRDTSVEEADSVLALDTNGDPMVMLSVIPGETEDKLSSEPSGGTCGAGGEEDSRCHIRESLLSLDSAGAVFPDREEEYYTEPEAAESDLAPTEHANNTESLKSPKVTCEERNVTGLENFTLKILNMSQDLMDFLNPNGSDCTLVLFYTPWCRFSANLAPHFNSLPRAFPTLHFLALDASQHSSLSTRFGTVAVPNILLFQGAKPMARFNHTERTLEMLKIFIFNQTGIEAKKNVVVTQADQIGPLPSTLIKSVDWLLVFSLFFLISFIMYATIRNESIRWLIPGQEQEHVE